MALLNKIDKTKCFSNGGTKDNSNPELAQMVEYLEGAMLNEGIKLTYSEKVKKEAAVLLNLSPEERNRHICILIGTIKGQYKTANSEQK